MAWLVLVVVSAGCTLPRHKDLDAVTKKAATLTEASNVISRFNRLRDAADSSGAVRGLAQIEGGSLLQLDAAAVFARQQLGVLTSSTRLDATSTIVSGSFERYPFWFLAVGDAYADRQKIAGVFVRESSTSPWLLTLAPRLATSTTFPAVGVSDDGAAMLLSAAEQRGLPVSPQTLVSRYVRLLADPSAAHFNGFVPDAFLASVRELQQAPPDTNATLTQTWSAQPVEYALRLAGGGALVFAELERTDHYRVLGQHALRWPGSEAATYIAHPVHSAATLTYEHQLLLMMPADSKPMVIGQYGGLVDARGH